MHCRCIVWLNWSHERHEVCLARSQNLSTVFLAHGRDSCLVHSMIDDAVEGRIVYLPVE